MTDTARDVIARWTESNEREHAAIVHRLRSQGWDRGDALLEADSLMADRIERREKAKEARDDA